jgi:tRNA nucleotidyltransferase (CCA-adding enzyme)
VQELAPPASIDPPASVRAVMERLWGHGHAAYVVGGSVRDALLGREPTDWDLATDARPDRLLAIFPGAVYENQFGTVAVREGNDIHQVTTFRSDHDYADFRRPHHVEFGDDLEIDLARRDFTINAIAWGAGARPSSGARAGTPPFTPPAPTARAAGGEGDAVGRLPELVDPFEGRRDLEARRIQAVGEPADRFREDALRMLRAVRFAATLEFTLDATTLRGIASEAGLARHVSGERVAQELQKLLAARRPSVGLRLLAETRLVEVLFPELAAQVGVPQNKIEGDDLWAHTTRTVDAAPPDRPIVRLAALLHDLGKPATLEDGPFRGHDVVGADLAEALLQRLRMPKAVIERVTHLVRQHMFQYEATWGDAGVRRFIQRVGIEAMDDLLRLREADSVGSGLPSNAGGLDELRARVESEIVASAVLDRTRLAVRGDDLMAELGLPAGPRLGRILDELLERVIADPAHNDRARLLALAATMIEDER